MAYDRPGIGQSDPHLKRNLNTSAEDMADIADALGMGSKFWVFAHGEGAVYAWAALYYIPTRLAGTLSILSTQLSWLKRVVVLFLSLFIVHSESWFLQVINLVLILV